MTTKDYGPRPKSHGRMSSMDTLSTVRAAATAAVERHDTGALRRLVENGATFAALSIRAHLKSHETWFAAWLAAGRPRDLQGITRSLAGMREGVIQGAMSLTDDELWHLASLPPLAAEMFLASHCPGLGAPKAAFALACAGLGRIACFDVHMLRAFGPAVTLSGFKPSAGQSRRNWWRYGYLLHIAYGDCDDTARLQWDYWLARHGRGMVHSALNRRDCGMNDPMSEVQRFAGRQGWTVHYVAAVAPYKTFSGRPTLPRVGGIIDGRGGGANKVVGVSYSKSDFDPVAVAYCALHELGHQAQWDAHMYADYAGYAADKVGYELDAWDRAIGWGHELGIVLNDAVSALIEVSLASYKVEADYRAAVIAGYQEGRPMGLTGMVNWNPAESD